MANMGALAYAGNRKFIESQAVSGHQRRISGTIRKVKSQHLRMCELKQIAEAVGAELIALGRGPKHAEDAA